MALPPNPYGSPPIYLPFSSVERPLLQTPSLFTTSCGFRLFWQPFAPVTDEGWNEALHAVLPVVPDPWHELIDYKLPAGELNIIIPFLVEKVSPVILITGPMIVNTVDTDPLAGVTFVIVNISTSLLAIKLNMVLDTGNYHLMTLATVVG